MFKFYKIIFFSSVMISTILVITSYSWLSIWMSLEINLLAFIPLMTNSKNMFPSEAALKYFISQALASNMLLFAIILSQFLSIFSENLNFSISIMFNSALYMKMGAAPFHFWFPEVISGLNWNNSLILLTWQKIAPMILIMFNLNFSLFIIIIISSLIGSIQNFNQIDLRKILAFSSINHISWMLASMLNSISIWLIYFLFYLIVSLNLILIFKTLQIFNLNQLFSIFLQTKMIKFLFILNFFSLSGLPPFLGFLPKWLTLNNLINNNFFMLSFIMVMFTLISMYIYLRITFSSFSLNLNESLMFYTTNSYYFILINFISISMLIIVMMMNMY